MVLLDLLSLPFVMPSIPRAMAVLLTEFDRAQPDLCRIDQIISTDPALATRVLQAANASVFELSGQIHCVAEALAVLRLSQLHAMVKAAASAISFKAVPGMRLPQFWAYSLDAARMSRSLAGLVNLNKQAAFTCGLIHAVGELALRMALPRALTLDTVVPPFDIKRAKAERKVLGFCYSQVSAGLARQWHLPLIMVDALEYQHAPFDNDAYEPLAGVIHLAVWRARTRQAGMTANELAVTFPAEVGEVMGLDIDLVLQQDPIDWSAPEGPTVLVNTR